MSKKLRELQARKATCVNRMKTIVEKADEENRDLTRAENNDFVFAKSESERLAKAIAEEERKIEAERNAPVRGTRASVGNYSGDTGGFGSFGEFATAVRESSLNGGIRDERLSIAAAAPGTFGSEGSGQDGGFIVPPEFSAEVFRLMLSEDDVLGLTDNTPISSNSMVFPKDETTAWGTDGVRAYWQAEAGAGTQTKPKLSSSTLRMHKLLALVPVSDELLDDATALNAYLPAMMARSINWKLSDSLFNGTGDGQPLGAFSSNAAVVQAKDAGQATKTISALNCANMVARLPPGSYKNARWYITPDALPSLFTLTLGNFPIYLPFGNGAGGVQGNPYGLLLGRPIEVSQHVAAFSSQGDLSLVDWTYYRTITKASGIETATSMHLYFDAAAVAFRAMFRIDGQPKILNPITQNKGSNTLSPFVQLAAR